MPRPAELDLWLTYAQANAMLLKWFVVGSEHFEKLVDVHSAPSSRTNSTFAVVHHVDRSGGKADARGRRRSAEIVKIFGCRPLRNSDARGRPAPENLQRRKPRWGERVRSGGLAGRWRLVALAFERSDLLLYER